MTHSHSRTVPEQTLEALQRLDSCTVSNAVELFQVRTRNEGFVNGSIRCIFPHFSPRIGYAVTARIRSSSTPIAGRCYYDRLDWWSYLLTIPAPRFIVAEDVDHTPGLGALFGEIHANISIALGSAAFLSNGAIRDLPGIEASGLQAFAGSIAVSHSYAHVVEFGEPVEIGGLKIKPGDLLHGDQHGVVSVPVSIASDIPKAAEEMLRSERELIQFCKSKDFSFHKLSEKIQRASGKVGLPDKDPK